jgi:hypothetical protein
MNIPAMIGSMTEKQAAELITEIKRMNDILLALAHMQSAKFLPKDKTLKTVQGLPAARKANS